MSYVQGFLIPVKTARKDEYRALAESTAPIFMDHGATRIVECWADDVRDGTRTDMKKAVLLEDDETVVFSWIAYPDVGTFERGRDAMMQDERMQRPAEMPFDGKRMIYGGFDVVHAAGTDHQAGGAIGYVDGIVGRIPAGGAQAVVDFERTMEPFFLERGATGMVSGFSTDIAPGTTTDFLRAVAASEGDGLTFGWLEWPDKATRDAGMAAMMTDTAMREIPPAFDGSTAIFGGFTVIFDSANR